MEKILPKIDIIPDAIRIVVFNLLLNAFESVHEKKSKAPKGYQPKVTISTRKLPRFIQIRIKDNGTGISEKDTKQLLQAFYTNKKSEKNSGLGLSESARIINVAHKGELLIESDPGNGSDFIIRFTTLILS
ncbi:MAG: ATP-binding protein [Bacteroidetes bacterium]|nr:ATP-binding protein [Bacteroidota bacterium]